MSESVPLKIKKINLLPGASRLQVKALRYRGKNKMITYLFLVLWVASVALVLVAFVFTGNKVKTTESRLATKRLEVDKYKNTTLATSRIRVLAKQVGDVLANRFEYSDAFKKFATLYDKSITISAFELRGKNSFVVSGSMPSYNVAVSVEKMIEDLNAGKYEGFKGGELVSFSWNPKSGWSFEMTVNI